MRISEIMHVKCLVVLPREDSKMFSMTMMMMMTMMMPPPQPHPHTDPLRKPGIVHCLPCQGSHAFLLSFIKAQTLHVSLSLCHRDWRHRQLRAVSFLLFLSLSVCHIAASPLPILPWVLMLTMKSQGTRVNLLTK